MKNCEAGRQKSFYKILTSWCDIKNVGEICGYDRETTLDVKCSVAPDCDYPYRRAAFFALKGESTPPSQWKGTLYCMMMTPRSRICAMSFLPFCVWREYTSVLPLPLNTIKYIMVMHCDIWDLDPKYRDVGHARHIGRSTTKSLDVVAFSSHRIYRALAESGESCADVSAVLLDQILVMLYSSFRELRNIPV